MPKQNQKTPKRSNHRIIESDDESHDSEHTPRTVNKGNDTEQGSGTDKDNDDEDYALFLLPVLLQKILKLLNATLINMARISVPKTKNGQA